MKGIANLSLFILILLLLPVDGFLEIIDMKRARMTIESSGTKYFG